MSKSVMTFWWHKHLFNIPSLSSLDFQIIISTVSVSLTNTRQRKWVKRYGQRALPRLSGENEERGVICSVWYITSEWGLSTSGDSSRMHSGLQRQRKGTASHFVALKSTSPVSTHHSLQSILKCFLFCFLEPHHICNNVWPLPLSKLVLEEIKDKFLKYFLMTVGAYQPPNFFLYFIFTSLASCKTSYETKQSIYSPLTSYLCYWTNTL